MIAAVLLRSVARKMSRAAAPTHHHPSLVAQGLHGIGVAGSGPANSNQIQQGTADVLVSSGMAAATGLRSGAGWLTTKMPPPPLLPYHRLVHGRGIHSRTTPDPIPPTTKKVLDTIDKATVGVAIVLASVTIYLHYWVRPKLHQLKADLREDISQVNDKVRSELHEMKAVLAEEISQLNNIKLEQYMGVSPTAPASAGPGNKTQKGTGDKLGKEEAVKKMHCPENQVKELKATVMDLKAENAKLKIALEACSQGKV